MTTLMLNENGYVQLPLSLLGILGWQTGNELELETENNKLTLINKNLIKAMT